MDKFKKGGNKFNSNITATNRLFAKNPLLKKRRKKAPGIYDPNAKYRFPDGGIVQLDRVPGSRFKKDASGTWVYESGAPVTDEFILQELNYGKGKPIGSPVVQGAPKVELKPYVTSGERIQKINDLQNSVKIADQQEANRLSQVQHHIDLYNPEVFEAERIKPEGLSDLQNWEWNVNEALNFPMERAHTAAAAATEDPGEEVDNLRHPLAGAKVAKGIMNATGNIPYLSPAMGFIGSNLLGAGHEAMTLLNPDKNDDRSFLTRLQESGEDLYNNYVGAKVGASDMTPEEKTNYLLYLSGTNRLPDGIVMEGKPKKGFSKNVYFKHSPTDPGKYKGSYAEGGPICPEGYYFDEDKGECLKIEFLDCPSGMCHLPDSSGNINYRNTFIKGYNYPKNTNAAQAWEVQKNQFPYAAEDVDSWYNTWYAQRMAKPEFAQLAQQRLNAAVKRETPYMLEAQPTYQKEGHDGFATTYIKKVSNTANKPFENKIIVNGAIYPDSGPNNYYNSMQAKPSKQRDYLFGELLHEKTHWDDNNYPQPGTSRLDISKDEILNNVLPKEYLIANPEGSIYHWDDNDNLLPFKFDEGLPEGQLEYLSRPTEVRARLNTWRQYNNISPTKDYHPSEIKRIIDGNVKNILNNPETVNPLDYRNILELYQIIHGDPKVLKELNDKYVSNDSNKELKVAAKGGDTGCPPGYTKVNGQCKKINAFVTSDPDEYAFRKAAYDDSLWLHQNNLKPLNNKGITSYGISKDFLKKYDVITNKGSAKDLGKIYEKIKKNYPHTLDKFRDAKSTSPYENQTQLLAEKLGIDHPTTDYDHLDYAMGRFRDLGVPNPITGNIITSFDIPLRSDASRNWRLDVAARYKKPVQPVLFKEETKPTRKTYPPRLKKPVAYVNPPVEERIPIEQPQPPIQDTYPPPPPAGGFPPGPPPPPPFNGVEPNIQGNEVPMYATPDSGAEFVPQKERYIDWDGNSIGFNGVRFRKPGHGGDLIRKGRKHYLHYPSIETRHFADIVPEEEEYGMGGITKYPNGGESKPRKNRREVKPFTTSNLKEYQKRKQAYDDSLTLYNASLQEHDLLKKTKGVAAYDPLYDKEAYDAYKRLGYPKGYNVNVKRSDNTNTRSVMYEKPVQPVNKKSKPVPKKSQQVKPIVEQPVIKKENPPIYTSDINDPRLKSYTDSLNLYTQYKAEENAFLKHGNIKGKIEKGSPDKYIEVLKKVGPGKYKTVKEKNPDYHPTIIAKELQRYIAPKTSESNVTVDGVKFNTLDSFEGSSPILEKPLQPVIYRPKNIIQDVSENFVKTDYPPGPPPFNGVEPFIQGDPIPEYATPDRDAQWVAQKERYIDWNGNNISYKLPRFRKPGHSGPLVKGSRTHYLRYPSIETRNSADIIPEEEEFAMGGEYNIGDEVELTEAEVKRLRSLGYIIEEV